MASLAGSLEDNPAAFSASQTTVGVASGTVASGSTDLVTLTAKDQYGNQLTSSGATVAFGNSGGTSTGSFGSTSNPSGGVYTSQFTGSTAGIGFASTNISDVTLARASRVTPTATSAQAAMKMKTARG